MRFGVLGSIEAWRDGTPVDVGHARQRRVLAALVMDVDRTVPADALLERVWGEEVPSRGREVLYGYVSRLRKALAPAGVDIVREQGGYRLPVETAAVDVHRFRELTDQARAADTDKRAVALWHEALELWRGEAFAEADTSWFNDQRSLLDAERLAAHLDLVEVRLRLGQHTRLLPELSRRAQRHPLDERVVGQLMLALHRCGRSSEALDCFTRLRRRLREELGCDPGQPIRDLHQRLLSGDPTLTAPAPPPPDASAKRPAPAERVPHVSPRQLPRNIRSFTGRGEVLRRLDKQLLDREGTGLATVTGPPGVGKTAFVVHWAHRVAEEFPDGQLFADLRGYSTERLTASQVLHRFLRALGVPGDDIPHDPDERSALFRSCLVGRRVLVVLDNASHADQIRSVLPTSPDCPVVVSSRSALVGLAATHDVETVSLDVLRPAESQALFARLLGGERAAAESEALREAADLCGHLPLALRLTAAHLAYRRHGTDAFLAELRRDRLGTLAVQEPPETSVRAAFDVSYRALPQEAQRVFRLLGLHPGPDGDADAAAALTGLPARHATAVLDQLGQAHLVRYSSDRWQLHDLLREFARQLCIIEDDEATRRGALTALLDWYLAAATAATRGMGSPAGPVPDDDGTPAAVPIPVPVPVPEWATAEDASAWLDAEHPALVAAIQLAAEGGWHRHAVRLTYALRHFFLRRRHTTDWISSSRRALTAARAMSDRQAEADILSDLGLAHCLTGDNRAAIAQYEEALALRRDLKDRRGEAGTGGNLGNVLCLVGRYADALRHATESMRAFRELGIPGGEANQLTSLGYIHTVLDRPTEAVESCERALTLFRRVEDRWGEAHALVNLGAAREQQAEYDRALAACGQAHSLFVQAGDRAGQAEALSRIGRVHIGRGQFTDGLRSLGEALELVRTTADRNLEATILNDLGEAHAARGGHTKAYDHHKASAAFDTGNRYEHARALRGIATALEALGDHRRALTYREQALTVFGELGLSN